MGNDTAKLSTTDIAQMIGLKAVTIRKYAMALEKAGYIVHRSEGGHREFSDQDAMVFQQLKTLCERSGMSVEIAAQAVAAKHQGASESVAVSPVGAELAINTQYEERYNTLLDKVEELSETNKQLMDRMDRQNENISAILREVLLTRQAIAATKDKKWYQFWKREEVYDPHDPELLWKIKNGR